MADVNTYTATPCGPGVGPTYEVSVVAALTVPEANLAAVRYDDDPVSWVCCVIDRDTTNQTPEKDVKLVQDSGYELADCSDCNDHWS